MPITILHGPPALSPFDPSRPPIAKLPAEGQLPIVRHLEPECRLEWTGAPAFLHAHVPVHSEPSSAAPRGDLILASDAVYWYDAERGTGFSVDYPSISLHALARRRDAEHPGHIYLQLDLKTMWTPDGEEVAIGDAGNGDSEGGVTEVRVIPANEQVLDVLYEAFSECASLHPDPNPEAFDDQDPAEYPAGDQAEDEDESNPAAKWQRLEAMAQDALETFHPQQQQL